MIERDTTCQYYLTLQHHAPTPREAAHASPLDRPLNTTHILPAGPTFLWTTTSAGIIFHIPLPNIEQHLTLHALLHDQLHWQDALDELASHAPYHSEKVTARHKARTSAARTTGAHIEIVIEREKKAVVPRELVPRVAFQLWNEDVYDHSRTMRLRTKHDGVQKFQSKIPILTEDCPAGGMRCCLRTSITIPHSLATTIHDLLHADLHHAPPDNDRPRHVRRQGVAILGADGNPTYLNKRQTRTRKGWERPTYQIERDTLPDEPPDAPLRIPGTIIPWNTFDSTGLRYATNDVQVAR